MPDQLTDQTTKTYITQITNWTYTYFLSWVPNNKSRENSTYMSHSDIITPGNSTANWWEAFGHVWALFHEKYMTQAMSFHQERPSLISILLQISEST